MPGLKTEDEVTAECKKQCSESDECYGYYVLNQFVMSCYFHIDPSIKGADEGKEEKKDYKLDATVDVVPIRKSKTINCHIKIIQETALVSLEIT